MVYSKSQDKSKIFQAIESKLFSKSISSSLQWFALMICNKNDLSHMDSELTRILLFLAKMMFICAYHY